MEIVAKENKVTVMDHVKGTKTTEEVEDPMMIPRRISETWKPQLIDDLPDVFCGEWICSLVWFGLVTLTLRS